MHRPNGESPRLRVAVVEDDETAREAVVDLLSRHGHRVVGLSCAEEMGDAVGGTPIDLLITGLDLPGEDGLSLVRRFREVQPLVGIIACTAKQVVAQRVAGYAAGADVCLAKPVAQQELLAAVSSIARRLASRQGAVSVEASPPVVALVLDSTDASLSGPASRVRLSENEAVILRALLEAPGQHLDLSQLFSLLGMDPTQYSKSAFEVRMVRLRHKLVEAGANKSCLRSVRLRGYQLGVVIHLR